MHLIRFINLSSIVWMILPTSWGNFYMVVWTSEKRVYRSLTHKLICIYSCATKKNIAILVLKRLKLRSSSDIFRTLPLTRMAHTPSRELLSSWLRLNDDSITEGSFHASRLYRCLPKPVSQTGVASLTKPGEHGLIPRQSNMSPKIHYPYFGCRNWR